MYGFDFSSIKSVALREPLVDTVDYKAVLTDSCAIMVKYSIKDNNFLSVHRETVILAEYLLFINI